MQSIPLRASALASYEQHCKSVAEVKRHHVVDRGEPGVLASLHACRTCLCVAEVPETTYKLVLTSFLLACASCCHTSPSSCAAAAHLQRLGVHLDFEIPKTPLKQAGRWFARNTALTATLDPAI